MSGGEKNLRPEAPKSGGGGWEGDELMKKKIIGNVADETMMPWRQPKYPGNWGSQRQFS